MFSDGILRRKFGKAKNDSRGKKYKWYFFPNAVGEDYAVILSDSFWNHSELLCIQQLLDGDAINHWAIVYRHFKGSHVEVCVIYCRYMEDLR